MRSDIVSDDAHRSETVLSGANAVAGVGRSVMNLRSPASDRETGFGDFHSRRYGPAADRDLLGVCFNVPAELIEAQSAVLPI